MTLTRGTRQKRKKRHHTPRKVRIEIQSSGMEFLYEYQNSYFVHFSFNLITVTPPTPFPSLSESQKQNRGVFFFFFVYPCLDAVPFSATLGDTAPPLHTSTFDTGNWGTGDRDGCDGWRSPLAHGAVLARANGVLPHPGQTDSRCRGVFPRFRPQKSPINMLRARTVNSGLGTR